MIPVPRGTRIAFSGTRLASRAEVTIVMDQEAW